MSLMQHYDTVIARMQADICRLVETASATYNDKRTSVDRKKLSELGLMVKESYKTIPSEFNGSEEETDVKTTESL